MTTRTLLFDSPFLLGFDQTRALIDRAAKAAAESYPPYNVEQLGDNAVRIFVWQPVQYLPQQLVGQHGQITPLHSSK